MNGVEMCRIYTPSFKNSELIDRDNQRTKRNRKWLMSVVSGRFFRSGKFLRVVKITKCEQFLRVKEYVRQGKQWVLVTVKRFIRQSKQFVLISVLIFSRFLDASHSDQQNSHTPVRWNEIQIERVSLSPGLATFSTEEHEALFGTGEIDLASSNSSKSSSSSFASALASPGPKRSSPRAGQFSSGSGSPGNPGDPGGSGDPEGSDSCLSEITKPPSVEKVEVTEERATFIENTIKKLKKDLAEESESEESDSEIEIEDETKSNTVSRDKEKRRNLYGDNDEILKIGDDTFVIHSGQSDFKTKTKGFMAGLPYKVNKGGYKITPSTEEHKQNFRQFVKDDTIRCSKLPLEKGGVKVIEYTTRNQPPENLKMVWDKESGYAHFFGITPDEKGNLPYKMSLDLDNEQIKEVDQQNTLGSMYKYLHE